MCSFPDHARISPSGSRAAAPRRAEGFSVVEMLVGVAIGMLVLATVSAMLIRHEGTRRGVSASSEVTVGTSHLAYLLDRTLRSAGSGFAQNGPETFGCALRAAHRGVMLLPRAVPFPAPFAAVPTDYRLAPVLVHPGAGADGSDIIAVASGHASMGGAGMRVPPSPITASAIPLHSTLSLRPRELLLLAQSGQPCMLQQIDAAFAPGVTTEALLGGPYATPSIADTTVSDYGVDAFPFVMPLGRPEIDPPTLQLIGIGADATLFGFDLLALDGSTRSVPLESGVVALRVRYGVDTDGAPGVDRWVAPTEADYLPASLSDGSAAARERLLGILALRVALVVRDTQLERDPVAPATLTLFPDLPAGLQVTVELDGPARRLRHRTLEFTVPLRNVILAGAGAGR